MENKNIELLLDLAHDTDPAAWSINREDFAAFRVFSQAVRDLWQNFGVVFYAFEGGFNADAIKAHWDCHAN